VGKISKTRVSNYPFKYDGIYNYPDIHDEVTEIEAFRINNLKDAVTNIEIAIGAEPVPDDYANIVDYITDISSGNFVRTDGDAVSGDIHFKKSGTVNTGRLFLGTNCNCSVGMDQYSRFNKAVADTDFDVGTKWKPSDSESVSNASGVVPLSIIGNSIYSLTSAGSMSGRNGHKIRIFDDVESKGAMIVSKTAYTKQFSFSPIEEIDMLNFDDYTTIQNAEVHGPVSANNILEYIGAEFSRSLEDDGPPEIILPANSGYDILFVIFSAYLPFKDNRTDVACDGLKLKLNNDNINNPSLFAPYDSDRPNSLNNVSLMNFMVIPSTGVTENVSGEFIVKFDPSIENRISLVRDGFTTFGEYPTLMHMVTVFGQKNGCYDVIRNIDSPFSFTATVDSNGTYVGHDGVQYTTS